MSPSIAGSLRGMFTDMVGYRALMQADERLELDKREQDPARAGTSSTRRRLTIKEALDLARIPETASV